MNIVEALKQEEQNEITIDEFFPVFCESLPSESDPFLVLSALREHGVKFSYAQKGLVGEKWPVEGIGVAIAKAKQSSDIKDERAMVQVTFGSRKLDYENTPLSRLFIRREEVEAAYRKLGLNKYPWPGGDTDEKYDEYFILDAVIEKLKHMKVETLLEPESLERQTAGYEKKLAGTECQISSLEPEDIKEDKAIRGVSGFTVSIDQGKESEGKTIPTISPNELYIIVDDINEKVTIATDRGKGKTAVYSRFDVVGRGTVTWDLLVDFAKCNGSLEGNTKIDVKRRNSSVNRNNLGKKLKEALFLNKSPVVEGRNGVMRFGSITIAGDKQPIDALNRKTVSVDDQTTRFLRAHGEGMPVDD